MDEEESLKKVERNRVWVLDQMTALARNHHRLVTGQWTFDLASFVGAHAYFRIKEDVAGDAKLMRCEPALSAATIEQLRTRLGGLLADLSTPPPRQRPTEEASQDSKDAKDAKEQVDADAPADELIAELHAFLRNLESQTQSAEPLEDLTSLSSARVKAESTLKKIKKQVCGPSYVLMCVVANIVKLPT
jgi:hypothetical protein